MDPILTIISEPEMIDALVMHIHMNVAVLATEDETTIRKWRMQTLLTSPCMITHQKLCCMLISHTDMGVSTAKQLMSLNLPEDAPDMVAAINKNL